METPTDAETVNAQFSAAAKTGQLAGILSVKERPLALSDYVNDTR